MSTATSYHGHDVIDLLLAASHTRPSLAAEVARRFGPDPRFHTCSADGLSLDQLLEFLASRKKLSECPTTGRLTFHTGQACSG